MNTYIIKCCLSWILDQAEYMEIADLNGSQLCRDAAADRIRVELSELAAREVWL